MSSTGTAKSPTKSCPKQTHTCIKKTTRDAGLSALIEVKSLRQQILTITSTHKEIVMKLELQRRKDREFAEKRLEVYLNHHTKKIITIHTRHVADIKALQSAGRKDTNAAYWNGLRTGVIVTAIITTTLGVGVVVAVVLLKK